MSDTITVRMSTVEASEAVNKDPAFSLGRGRPPSLENMEKKADVLRKQVRKGQEAAQELVDLERKIQEWSSPERAAVLEASREKAIERAKEFLARNGITV